MKERPILFSSPMVMAILDGRKTQTRRVVKPQPVYRDIDRTFASWVFGDGTKNQWLYPNAREEVLRLCPHGVPGSRLWVRETFSAESRDTIHYRADGFQYEDDPGSGWKPSIFMPRWASRITLEITDVRVQRLQDITRLDIADEGWPTNESQECQVTLVRELHWEDDHIDDGAIEWYADLWDAINGKGAWDANPWVWALTFRRADSPAPQEPQSVIEHEEAKAK